MNAKYGGIYTTGVIPAKTYPGQDKDNTITVVQNILVANAKMPDKVAYDIVKTFIEKRDELIAVHGEAKSITLREPEREELADPVASRRDEVLHREGREDVNQAGSFRQRPVGIMPAGLFLLALRTGRRRIAVWLTIRLPTPIACSLRKKIGWQANRGW